MMLRNCKEAGKEESCNSEEGNDEDEDLHALVDSYAVQEFKSIVSQYFIQVPMFPASNRENDCFAYRIRNAEINAFTISIDKLCTGLSASLKAVSKTLSSDKFGGLKDYFKVYLNQLCKRIYHIRRQATISIIHTFLAPELK
jgi:hypothetical protein